MKRREFLKSVGIVAVVGATTPLLGKLVYGVNDSPIVLNSFPLIYTSKKTYGQLSISGVAMDARYRYYFTPEINFKPFFNMLLVLPNLNIMTFFHSSLHRLKHNLVSVCLFVKRKFKLIFF